MKCNFPTFVRAALAIGSCFSSLPAQSQEPESIAKLPPLSESPAQHDARMQWFRDAKFGMFIHWGPCSVGQKEIGWGREANRPWDINKHGPRTADPVYDNYYKEFNPIWEQRWLVPVTRFHAGIDVPGRPVRYLKVETKGDKPRPMLLQRFTVYGDE